ncbi:MAG TPA: hypothetical protein VFQ38_00450 [Longimicrobiales bacterium]|nr:hypothetical protein [Longimicrobiales bacterium]
MKSKGASGRERPHSDAGQTYLDALMEWLQILASRPRPHSDSLVVSIEMVA